MTLTSTTVFLTASKHSTKFREACNKLLQLYFEQQASKQINWPAMQCLSHSEAEQVSCLTAVAL
jgi:hypothetical protein